MKPTDAPSSTVDEKVGQSLDLACRERGEGGGWSRREGCSPSSPGARGTADDRRSDRSTARVSERRGAPPEIRTMSAKNPAEAWEMLEVV